MRGVQLTHIGGPTVQSTRGATPGRASIELFYEDDDLLPHLECAWALLEERVRDATTFCAAVTKSAPEDVASALGPPERALRPWRTRSLGTSPMGRGESLCDQRR